MTDTRLGVAVAAASTADRSAQGDAGVSGAVAEFGVRVELGPSACAFIPGHRVRVESASSDFPRFALFLSQTEGPHA